MKKPWPLAFALLGVSCLPQTIHAEKTGLVTIESLDSEIDAMLLRYQQDRGALERKYRIPMSEKRRTRLRRFFEETRTSIERIRFEVLGVSERVNLALWVNEIEKELAALEFERARDAEIAPLLPYAPRIVERLEAHVDGESIEPVGAAEQLHELAQEIDEARETLTASSASATVARRASERVDDLRRALESWFRFHDGYEPMFSWWVAKPFEAVDRVLTEHSRTLVDKLVRSNAGSQDTTLIGDPIGREALLEALARELIPYTPEELIRIAETELAWCRQRRLEASRALGFGDDWQRALDHVKGLHEQPGGQPALVRKLAQEAITFLEEKDLITIPELAKETWRLQMMSPERQLVNPYFTGGEVISVSFPTADMEHADKLMSLRGNNVHFSRATVHHELIPGHHLQQFMQARHHPERRPFATPFWTEGWALYWEMRLWDLDFPKTDKDKMGFLFWRTHRCARIVFSLSFHLGKMTVPEAVDYLVENVGHERRNATAEVRRSVGSAYSPLYQAAYMLGGLQFRALHRELVSEGGWTERQFHDRILQESSMPVEMVRVLLHGKKLESPNLVSRWRFYDENTGRSER
ncbi:MAG: DUF885 family protein [Planctomycetota bacterium]